MTHVSLGRLAGFVLVALVGAWLSQIGPARAADEEARKLYIDNCSKCHGGIGENQTSSSNENLLRFVVMMPIGPPLTGVFGRVAGTVEDYPYSKSFRAMAKNPWVWDEPALDLWITSSQDFIRGSTMFLKVADPEDRAKITGYLKKYSQFRE